MTDVCPKRRDDNTWRDIGGEVVILDEDGTRVCLLNSTAAMIWALADGTRTVNQLAAHLYERFDVDPAAALADTREFSMRLQEAGLADLTSPAIQMRGE